MVANADQVMEQESTQENVVEQKKIKMNDEHIQLGIEWFIFKMKELGCHLPADKEVFLKEDLEQYVKERWQIVQSGAIICTSSTFKKLGKPSLATILRKYDISVFDQYMISIAIKNICVLVVDGKGGKRKVLKKGKGGTFLFEEPLRHIPEVKWF